MRMNAPQSLQLSDPINSYLFIYLFWRANLFIDLAKMIFPFFLIFLSILLNSTRLLSTYTLSIMLYNFMQDIEVQYTSSCNMQKYQRETSSLGNMTCGLSVCWW